MSAQTKIIRAINFDLKIAELKKYYSKNSPKNAYREIKAFMENEGFAHRQFSGYVSLTPMTDRQVVKLAMKMDKQFPWLHNCIEKFDVTNVKKLYDLKHVFGNSVYIEHSNSSNAKANHGEPPPPSPSNGAIPLDGWKTEIAAMREKSELAKPQSPARHIGELAAGKGKKNKEER